MTTTSLAASRIPGATRFICDGRGFCPDGFWVHPQATNAEIAAIVSEARSFGAEVASIAGRPVDIDESIDEAVEAISTIV